jgi:hypothetical protein
MVVSSSDAERIADEIFSTNDDDEEILAISIMDMRGNILAAKSTESFKEAFRVTVHWHDYGGTLALAALSLVNQVRNVFEEAKAMITIHKNCKLMLLSSPSFQILVGLVLQRSVNAEDHDIANNIKDWWQIR